MPLLGHMHPPFFKIMDEIQEGLRYVFQTRSKYTCLISGTGHAGGRPPAALPSGSRPAMHAMLIILALCACQGCVSRAGMEACITNLLEPGETVVIGDKGIWGARAADMAGRFGSALPHSPCLASTNLLPTLCSAPAIFIFSLELMRVRAEFAVAMRCDARNLL